MTEAYEIDHYIDPRTLATAENIQEPLSEKVIPKHSRFSTYYNKVKGKPKSSPVPKATIAKRVSSKMSNEDLGIRDLEAQIEQLVIAINTWQPNR